MRGHGKPWLFILGCWAVATIAMAGEGVGKVAAAVTPPAGLAWQSENPYVPPDFAHYFPDDESAGRWLDAALRASARDNSAPNSATLDLVRRGFRRAQGNILRWVGNTLIWGVKPQNPQAIEIMYQAAGSPDPFTRHMAVYFGLSVVRPKTKAILRTLADLAMRTDEADIIGRIAWGAEDQRAELLAMLQPYLASADPAKLEHARALEKIFKGELKAWDWSREQKRRKAEQHFAGQMPQVRQSLIHGDSQKREETLNLIQRERLDLLMDDSFLAAYARAAEDPSPKVRKSVAAQVGSRWIGASAVQNRVAIDLILTLSRDPIQSVRRTAVDCGLSSGRNKSDAVIRRLLELLVQTGLESNFRDRIIWGLRYDKPRARVVLDQWIHDVANHPLWSVLAYGYYEQVVGEKPETQPELNQLLDDKSREIGSCVLIAPAEGNRRKGNYEQLFVSVGQALPEKYRSRLQDVDAPMLLLEGKAELDEIVALTKTGAPLMIFRKMPLTPGMLLQLARTGKFR